MRDFFHLILITFATLFPITNPLGNAAIFLSITKGQNSAQKRRQAFMGSLYMFFILEGFFLGGSYIINFFGLSMPGIRIAGGLVVTKIGFNLLTPKQEQTHSEEENQEAKRKEDISFSPLAIPLLAGPGGIASIMVWPRCCPLKKCFLTLLFPSASYSPRLPAGEYCENPNGLPNSSVSTARMR